MNTSSWFQNVPFRFNVRRYAAVIEVDAAVKAVLINGHFDTTLGSPGAADCASCVGIMLEALRALIHNQPRGGGASTSGDSGATAPRGLTAPVVFLFNGGEETFMQAAHGFVAHHPWAPSVGVVLNVEATGSGGPDVLFREAGGWPAEAYMRAAPRPTATAGPLYKLRIQLTSIA